MYNNELQSDIQYLPGVGPKRAELLRKELAVNTVGDLIRVYPFRYIDRSAITKIVDIAPDTAFIQVQAKVIRSTLLGRGGQVLFIKDINGSVISAGNNSAAQGRSVAVKGDAVTEGQNEKIKFNLAKRLSVIVEDGSGQMELVFFRGIKYTFNRLEPGNVFLFFGKPASYMGRINIVHPEIDNPINDDMSFAGNHALPAMTGVYSSTERLKDAGITGKVMNKLMANALRLVLEEVPESLPDYVMKDKNLVPIHFALHNIHFPIDGNALQKAIRRLKFEELFFLQLSLLKQKYVRSRGEKGLLMPKVGEAFNICYNALPYDLTGAQKRVVKEIRADLMSGHQMNRLLQGDVGSGKTMVAVLSSLIAIGNGYQACMMAPTEVLAIQHFANIRKYLKSTGVQCALLTGSTKMADRKIIREGLMDGTIDLIVGTHALIEDNVLFRNLGLAVIDEQHRFGVDQRAKLWTKTVEGIPPHVLVMTATPIPRTLAMTLYGDLDVSVIDEMPPGRKPIQTMLITERKRYALNRFIKDQIALGRQIFVVYPLIFESEKLDYQNLEKGYERMAEAFPFPPYKLAIVHGQQNNDDKNFNMEAFVAGRADILVSTTVIEVGVDVPNASVMVIESAERFGLSQLHQLRGRVGRGGDNSYCILVKGDKVSRESQKRLELMCATEDGFTLAEEDMKMRGPGDLEGTQQSGLPISLNIASLAKDGRILAEARAYAEYVLSKDPTLSMPENQRLAVELRKDKYRIKDYSKIS